MKKVLCMAALALLAASCSNDENEQVIDGKVGNVSPIQITQTVAGVKTKAAIGSGSTVEAVILTHDGSNDFSSFVPKYDNTLNESNEFANATDRANVSIATFQAGTAAKDVTLSTTLYYSTTKGDEVYILGVAPKGDIIQNKAIQFSQDGKQDVMYADKSSAGSENSHDSKPTLAFKHLTTQLKFAAKITRVANGVTGEWGGASVHIKSIAIHNVSLPASLTFNDGKVAWASPLDHFSVPEIITTPLSSTATEVSQPVMMNASSSTTIDVVITVGTTEKSYINLPVNDEKTNSGLETEISKSHLITLDITEPAQASGISAITAQATVDEWTEGNSGTVTIK